MTNCELCNIIINEKYRVVYDDKWVFVAANDSPLKDGHVMVMPIRHAENLADLTPEEAQAFLRATDHCMQAAKKRTGETAIASVKGWEHRSQPHLHLHVIPSKSNLRELFAAAEGVERRVLAEQSKLEEIAKAFRKCIE